MLLLSLIIFLSLKGDSGEGSENDKYKIVTNLLHPIFRLACLNSHQFERDNLVEHYSLIFSLTSRLLLIQLQEWKDLQFSSV